MNKKMKKLELFKGFLFNNCLAILTCLFIYFFLLIFYFWKINVLPL